MSFSRILLLFIILLWCKPAYTQKDTLKNQIAITYVHSWLNIDEWQQGRFEYQRKIGETVVLGRYSIEKRFGQLGRLAEVEAYPKLSEKSYAYLGLGFGSTQILPATYIGGTYYHSLKKNFEIEVGGKWIHFRQVNGVTLAHIAPGYYVGNYWLNLRFTQVFTKDKKGQSVTFTGRKYGGNGISYAFWRTGWSNTISEELIVGNGDTATFNRSVVWLQLGWLKRIKYRWIIEPSLAFELADWQQANERRNLTAQIELKRRF